ncbi:glycosyl hydrolase-like protein family 88 [Delitschia confertaspora ATCC 74209]|uniref:Glycosyl hydrolase-like protein family 88 n=1 Tax=Delitschia confertaspora ATCC 74209 TaxID=1513339 RepID=A0A9P4JKN0_9PLEO|nr:glycosyl hydrolase-like protein family 88 [Delitschia confertaspora ATCC 74209]
MYSTLLPLLLLSPLATAAPSPKQPYSTWMASSWLQKSMPLDRHYAAGVVFEGIQKAGALHSNKTLLSAHSTSVSSLVAPNGTLIGWDPNYFSLDDIRIGNNILYEYQTTKSNVEKEKYKKAAAGLRDQLNRFPRTPSGGFWHRDPQYKNQMWLDGLYMAEPFYATYTSLFDSKNTTAWNDIARQFSLVEEHCRNTTSGLLVHGYDESKTAVWADPVTGASPHVWDRAVGWYFVALVEVLQVYPKNLPGYKKLSEYLTTLAVAVQKAQDKSGGWWLVMDEPYPGMEGNYIESSATAMFTYAYLKGMRTGLLPKEKYTGVANKAWNLMLDKFVKVEKNQTLSWEGTVQVGSLNMDGSYEYYISVPVVENDPKGAGPFMFAATEMEILEKKRH